MKSLKSFAKRVLPLRAQNAIYNLLLTVKKKGGGVHASTARFFGTDL